MSALENGGIVGDEGFEFPQARIDDAGFADMAMNGLLRLEAVAGDAENDTLVAWDFPCLDEFAGAGDGDATGGFGKIPAYSARSRMPRITSSSEQSSALPPVSVMLRMA